MSFIWSISVTVLIPLVLLIGSIIVMDLVRNTPGKRWIRVLFILLAGIALYGLQVPLFTTFTPVKKDVLIQSGKSVLPDSLMKDNAVLFEDLTSWLKSDNSFATNSLTVYGSGLEDWELAMIQQPFSYIPGKIEEGVLGIYAPVLFSGMLAELTGEIQVDRASRLEIILPGGSKTTLEIAPSTPLFSAKITPPTAGNQLIQLIGTREGDTLFHEHFPVTVYPQPNFKTLLLSGFPTFEQRALVEWMESLGYRAVTIQQLTEERYRTNFYNQPVNRKLKTNSSYIQSLDLLILDEVGLSSLSNSSQATIKLEVKKGKLALLWLDEPEALGKLLDINTSDANKSEIAIPSEKGQIKLASRKKYISSSKGPSKSSSLWASIDQGFGRVTQPVFSNSYLLKLQGEDSLYNEVWSALFDATLGVSDIEKKTKIDPYTAVGKKSIVEVKAPVKAKFQIDDQVVYPRQNALVTSWVSLDYFPEDAGWQPIIVENAVADYVYVSPAEKWKSRSDYRKQQLTKLASSRSQAFSQPGAMATKVLNNWWWYALLLGSLACLWIEQRIRS